MVGFFIPEYPEHEEFRQDAQDYIGDALGFLRVGIDIEDGKPYLFATLDELPGMLATGEDKYELLDDLIECIFIWNQVGEENRRHEPWLT